MYHNKGGVLLFRGVLLLKIFACGASEKAQFFGPAGQNERFAITIQMRKRYLGVVRAAGEKILSIFMSRMQFLLRNSCPILKIFLGPTGLENNKNTPPSIERLYQNKVVFLLGWGVLIMNMSDR